MKAASAGVRITVESRHPPFIVVNSCIDQIIVARWSGKLWLVRIADAVTEDDERTTGLVRPVSSAGYIRAVAVDVMSEIPSWKLFGNSGEAVCAVIEQATSLDPDRVNALAQHRAPSAGNAYSRAWNNWLSIKSEPAEMDDLTGTLRMFSRGSGSPINCGFTVIHRAVWDRAEAVAGDSAFMRDEEGEKYLEPTWSCAANSLLEAAMAFGAPSVSEEEDRRIMSAAWQRVIGLPPLGVAE
jgi:hypothetical protein